MTTPDTDADTPTVNERQVVDDAPEVPANDPTDAEDDEAVIALHAFLEKMEQNIDSTSEADISELCDMLAGDYADHVNARNPEGFTTLHLAAKLGLLGAAEVLMDSGADISIKDGWDESQPLHHACLNGHRDVAKLLLDRGADVNAQRGEGDSPLDDACWKGHTEIVSLLLENGAAVDAYNGLGWSPLYTAAHYGQDKVVELLLHHDRSGIDLEQTSRDWTALHVAASEGHESTVEVLLREGATIDAVSSGHRTPLMAATRNRHEGVMRQLLSPREGRERPQIEMADSDGGWTPLSWSARYGFLAECRILIDAGADCNARSKSGSTPLMQASSYRYREIALALLGAGEPANLNDQNKLGQTPLILAVTAGHTKMVELLLKHKPDVTLKCQEGRQALHIAALQGKETVMKMLLDTEAGQQVDVRTDTDLTPLHMASLANEGHLCEVREAQMGPDNLTPEERRSPEFHCGRHVAMMQLLLEKGANSKARCPGNHTALHIAAHKGDVERVEVLLDHMDEVTDPTLKSLDVNPYSSDEFNALGWAAGNLDRHHIAQRIIMKRLKLASDPTPAASEAWGPIEWATYARIPAVLFLLLGTSRQSEETTRAVEAARKMVQNSVAAQDAEDRLDEDQHILDILRDPGTEKLHQECGPIGEYPTYDPRLSGFPDDHEATVVRLYKGSHKFDAFPRRRSVREVIYDKGPKGTMDEAVQNVKLFDEKRPWVAEPRSTFRIGSPTCTSEKPKFTWIHLPCTNMAWMNDLVQRIAKDEEYDAGQAHQAKAFLRDSHVEVPDKVSKLRFMRPRFAERDPAEQRNNDRKGGKKQAKNFLATSAIYMPYLSFSIKCHEECRDASTEQERSELQILHEETERYQALLEAYDGEVIHGSPTLDEWHHRFDSDPETAGERRGRNESQVVTKSLPGGARGNDHWPLIRVNQLWVWIIDSKWLITASSYAIDGSKHTFVNGILDHIARKNEAGVLQSQPGTPAEMSKLIVEYCVGSFERQPKAQEDWETMVPLPPSLQSIRDMFFDSINTIGRSERKLFEELTCLHRGQGEHGKDENDKPNDENKMKSELKAGIKKAENLLADIKHVRDELDILRAVAEHQRQVQDGMNFGRGPKGHVRAAHVVTNIREMDRVAERIQGEINTTLSLAQSEMTNLLATLCLEQAREAMKQDTRFARWRSGYRLGRPPLEVPGSKPGRALF